MPLCPEKTSRCLLVAKGKTVWIFKIAARKAISLAANRRAITMTNLDLYNFPRTMWYVQVHSGEIQASVHKLRPSQILDLTFGWPCNWARAISKIWNPRQTPRTCRQTRETTVKTPRLPHLEGYWPRSDRWIPHHQSSTPQNDLALLLMFFWLVVEPTPLKTIGNLTQIRVKRKKIETTNQFFILRESFFRHGVLDLLLWWNRPGPSLSKAKEYTQRTTIPHVIHMAAKSGPQTSQH